MKHTFLAKKQLERNKLNLQEVVVGVVQNWASEEGVTDAILGHHKLTTTAAAADIDTSKHYGYAASNNCKMNVWSVS